MIKMKFTFDVMLLDSQLLSSAFKYYCFVCDYLMYLADPEKKGHPLDKEAPLVFRVLPEFMVEDIADFFIFLARFSPETFCSDDSTPVINFIVMFLAQPDYVKSPHLRSKLAEIIYMFTPDYQEQSGARNNAEFLFDSNPFVQTHLAKGLMDFYQG
jgi:ubiquitin conjugation factor E4 B